MIIDCHGHPDWMGYDFSQFIRNMDEHGIKKTWLLSWESPADEVDPGTFHCFSPFLERGPIPFERCLSYAERAPERFILGYAPDPRRPGAIEKLHGAIDIYGVRVCGELKLRMTYDDPDALRLFRFCGEKGLPVTVHIDYEFPAKCPWPRPNWWYGGGIAALERALGCCPGTVFLGHAPGFWAHISGDGKFDREPYPSGAVLPGGDLPRLMREYPNLHCDISAGSGLNALSRDPEHAARFLLEFQDRVLFGRDNYFDSRHRDFLGSLGLPAGVLEKILSGNAERLVSG